MNSTNLPSAINALDSLAGFIPPLPSATPFPGTVIGGAAAALIAAERGGETAIQACERLARRASHLAKVIDRERRLTLEMERGF